MPKLWLDAGRESEEATNSTPDQDPAADDSKGKRFAQAAIRHSKV
jgi:hypothetical protein